MESFLLTILASSSASLITGFFTWKAAIGAQKRAASIEKQNREIDQETTENKAQLRAVADYFQEVAQLRKEWRRQSEAEISAHKSHQGESAATKAALELRHQYLTDLRNATRSLDLYIYDQQISREVERIIEIVGDTFVNSETDFREFSKANHESIFRTIHYRVLKAHDQAFDELLDQVLDSLYLLSREQFGFWKKPDFKGLFT
ncbi:hypothetical protein CFAEC_13465 [Corynebacterium faecale]|uniref:hypothetical protein n=1 Tax=Corynebacterium faecale TaxID=1758466 RepID=UPI0025B4AD1E|nr:hypothetical protein [Corynebacterium faecale]WJY93478.1 hypothetical protein CFAEC_13465 [Corynebacterium faecale]